MAAPRRKTKIGHRRRVEDEGEDDGGPEALELDDDSMTEGSIASEDHDTADDSDTSNIDEVSPTSLGQVKSANGAAKPSRHQLARHESAPADTKAVSDAEMMLHGLDIKDDTVPVQDIDLDEAVNNTAPPKSPSAPIAASSASRAPEPVDSRRRQEHDDYKKRRDEDPAFVPNRGSFFMHDHRHAGPAANGFRPFGRGRGRGGRGGIGGPFSPMKYVLHPTPPSWFYDANLGSQIPRPGDPTTNSQWTHDMHETVAEPGSRRVRQLSRDEGPANGTGYIATREPSSTPINRTLSTEKHIGNVQVRVFVPYMKTPIVKQGVPVKQYTKLPDHRPPLRRDKPVRISLPNRQPRYIYPAVDRSFIFIPRAMRPGSQRGGRGKPRSVFGSVGGFSRRTSVFGGSYYGSMYSPSVAMSRRSSIGPDRDMFSPTGSVISRAAVPVELSRPVVRLPPAQVQMGAPMEQFGQYPRGPPSEASISGLPPPYSHPLPQKPTFQENLPADIPMHQPRPQKNISIADIDSPTLAQGPQAFQQAFHHQVPVQIASGYPPRESHSRQPSYPTHHSTGTPLSQIPERAIHAAPFQPHVYGQPQPQPPYYPQHPYPAQAQQPGYYYPQSYPAPNMAPPAAAPTFVPQAQQDASSYNPQGMMDPTAQQSGVQGATSNMVAQEANGMVYYFDPSQVAGMNAYPSYPPPPQGYQHGVMGMGGIVTPSPDGYYYPQAAPGMVYYSQ